MEQVQQPNQVLPVTPIQPPKPSVSIPMMIVMMVIISLLSSFGTYMFMSSQQPRLQQLTNQISPTPLIPTEKPAQQNTSVPTVPITQVPTTSWKNTTMSLYKMSLKIPTDWTIQESNRRPEPTGDADPKTGHDCSDYVIKNSDSTTIITIKPTCGFADGGGDLLPPNSIVIKNINKDTFLFRYPTTTINQYAYAHGGNVQTSDEKGTRQEQYSGRILSYGEGNNLTFMNIFLNFTGPSTQLEKSLQIGDQIVTSVSK